MIIRLGFYFYLLAASGSPLFVSSLLAKSRHAHKLGIRSKSGAEYRTRSSSALFSGDAGREYDHDDDEILALQDDDWRAFRAKLVKSEQQQQKQQQQNDYTYSKTANDPVMSQDVDGIGAIFQSDFIVNATMIKQEMMGDTTILDLDPVQWAYDSGDVVEQGAVLLGGVEQTFGFGLRQQHFHKAAILVLDHSEVFTKGILLNRPTDMMLEDDINKGKLWRVWFGGHVDGINSKHPAIVCLHSLKNNEMAAKGSIPVLNNDIQWTTFENAKKLVKAGVAEVEDFWVFVGYAGWGRGQLQSEITQDYWYTIATDSVTLLKELDRQRGGADPRDAGLDTWSLLMTMIGREDTAKSYARNFDDLMLKEWAFRNLLSTAAGGGAGSSQESKPAEFNMNPELVAQLMSRIRDPDRAEATPMIEGTLVRASSAERSPFLLDNQEFHKSVVLVLLDDDSATIGVVLNRPSSKTLDIKVEDCPGGHRVVSIPMRFGGQYGFKGVDQPLVWLHCSKQLSEKGVGTAVGAGKEHQIFTCAAPEVIVAIEKGIAQPDDFLIISGLSVWEKNDDKQGMEGALEAGKFELVPTSLREQVWSALLQQREVLDKTNLLRTLRTGEVAWEAGAVKRETSGEDIPTPIVGLGDGFDEEDDSLVYKSDTKVSDLSFEALQYWCATFLLGLPGLGR